MCVYNNIQNELNKTLSAAASAVVAAATTGR